MRSVTVIPAFLLTFSPSIEHFVFLFLSSCLFGKSCFSAGSHFINFALHNLRTKEMHQPEG